VKELWTPDDDRSLAAFVVAVRVEDLVGALQAVAGTPDAVRAADEAALEAFAARVAGQIAEGSTAFLQARALADVLGSEEGFSGDEDDYYHPDNCLLHPVLERRRGMPILLSTVWIEVGKRAGLQVEGVGLPGHFIVRVGTGPGVLVDPFGGGSRLTVDECRRKVQSMSGGKLRWRSEFLRPTGVAVIVERVLHNLAGCYGRARDEAGRFRVLTFLSALRPDEPENFLQRAEVAEELGVRDLAQQVYAEIVERFPETQQAQTAIERLTDGDGSDAPSPVVN
jgi:regulator of sirC expression with transglutaminase-like and TPR domain